MKSHRHYGRRRRFALTLAAVSALAAPLGGCVGLAVGAGATAATAASEERGLDGAAHDLRIRTTINTLWLDYSEPMATALNLDISEGRVLITGVVPEQAMREKAEKLAWRAKGVREVYNEVRVAEDGIDLNDVRDGWITAQLRTRLTLDSEVAAINYAIETVGGTVYLLGIAQDRAELSRIRDHARTLSYVRRIVSHVIMKDDPRRPPKKRETDDAGATTARRSAQ